MNSWQRESCGKVSIGGERKKMVKTVDEKRAWLESELEIGATIPEPVDLKEDSAGRKMSK